MRYLQTVVEQNVRSVQINLTKYFRTQMKNLIILFAAVMLPLLSYAEKSPVLVTPQKFKTPEEMADFTQDYTIEEGTFKVISRQPLHIEVRITEVNPDQQFAAEAMFRAFLWGYFERFCILTLPV